MFAIASPWGPQSAEIGHQARAPRATRPRAGAAIQASDGRRTVRYAKESYRMAAGGGTAYWSMMHFPLASRSNVQPSRPFSVQKYAAPHGRRPRSCRQVRERALPEPGRSVRRQASRKPSRSASRRWVRANERVGAEALRDPAAPRDYPDLAAAAWPRRVGLRARCMGARQSRSPGGSPTCPRRRPKSS